MNMPNKQARNTQNPVNNSASEILSVLEFLFRTKTSSNKSKTIARLKVNHKKILPPIQGYPFHQINNAIIEIMFKYAQTN
jgi:hypothetical protein